MGWGGVGQRWGGFGVWGVGLDTATISPARASEVHYDL